MIWDYVVFAVFILGCSMIAIYSKFAGPKERTKADYVFATGSVSMAAMMMSIARGTLGVRSFLGKSILELTPLFFYKLSPNVGQDDRKVTLHFPDT
jgi:hypothetical protein